MHDHNLEKHPGDTIDHSNFKFSIVSSHKDPLTRQVTEAVRILQATDNKIFTESDNAEILVKPLNRRLEHFAPRERIIKGQNF